MKMFANIIVHKQVVNYSSSLHKTMVRIIFQDLNILKGSQKTRLGGWLLFILFSLNFPHTTVGLNAFFSSTMILNIRQDSDKFSARMFAKV